jgi:hypothetical protein
MLTMNIHDVPSQGFCDPQMGVDGQDSEVRKTPKGGRNQLVGGIHPPWVALPCWFQRPPTQGLVEQISLVAQRGQQVLLHELAVGRELDPAGRRSGYRPVPPLEVGSTAFAGRWTYKVQLGLADFHTSILDEFHTW